MAFEIDQARKERLIGQMQTFFLEQFDEDISRSRAEQVGSTSGSGLVFWDSTHSLSATPMARACSWVQTDTRGRSGRRG